MRSWGRCLVSALGALTLTATLSCQPPPPPPATSLAIRARAETGAALSNVEIFAGSALVARTDAEGRAHVNLTGADGLTFELKIKCPEGFRSPLEPLIVRRIVLAGPSNVPEYAVTCHATRHTLVVVVRADGRPGLPVVYLGKTIAQTDRSGVAHVMMDMDVRERVELTISTAGKENEKLHPQNPVQYFELADSDAIQFFDVTFSRDPKVKAPPVKAKPGPTVF